MPPNKILKVSSNLTNNGFDLKTDNKNFSTVYPADIWQKTPVILRKILLENITFAETHWLPLILKGYVKVAYNTCQPFFEPLLFKNQLYDLLFSESADEVRQLTYLKQFYNLEYLFSKTSATGLNSGDIPVFKSSSQRPIAIIPFTFGKESLLLV